MAGRRDSSRLEASRYEMVDPIGHSQQHGALPIFYLWRHRAVADLPSDAS